MGRNGVLQATRRRETWPRRIVYLALLAVCALCFARASVARTSDSVAQAPVHHAVQKNPQDIVVAGGIDGRVYAMNAWTGDVMWMFDSGGPMVDSSDCSMAPPSPPLPPRPGGGRRQEPQRMTTVDVGADGRSSAMEQQWRRRQSQDVPHTSDATNGDAVASASSLSRTANQLVGVSQMIPSYDGRLYHIDGTNVRELEMSMIDIINANGPVRLRSSASDAAASGTDADAEAAVADLLLFGEKETKIFSLDAVQGVIQPYLASSSSPTILFGRAEFKTKAVHARNMSAAKCFTISEYFLQFAEQSKCSNLKNGHRDDNAMAASPKILVLPKDPDAAHPEEEESTIAAYDPWTNKQLWERQIPHFDVIAVFGVSATREASFFTWNMDGPSSTASTLKKKDLVIAEGASAKDAKDQGRPENALGATTTAAETSIGSVNHLVKTVARDWPTMQSHFRLRLLDGNFYLEQNEDDDDGDDGSESMSSAASYYDSTGTGDMRPKRKRRVFWESMESGGKKGVFITYYHVGAMTLGTMVGCMLIAWGFYVKGLSASGVIMKSLDQQFLSAAGHVHQLTIERPGQENITISSSISRSLLMDAASSFGFAPSSRPLPMIDNGDETYAGSSSTAGNQVKLDPETEAMLMEKFSKMVALEAAAALSGSRFSNNNLMQLECDPDSSSVSTTRTSSTLTLLSDASSSTNGGGRVHRRSLMGDESDEVPFATAIQKKTTKGGRSNMTEDNDGRLVYVIEELENSNSDSLFEVTDCGDDVVEEIGESGVDCATKAAAAPGSSNAVVVSDRKSTTSWISDDAASSHDSGSCSESSGTSDEDSEEISSDNISETTELATGGGGELTNGSTSAAEISNPRKASNASSSASSGNEAEVLFPFVCQSRFANEFVELSALGKGGFGQVMLAENRLDGRKYAIKRVGLHLKHQTSKTLQKFLREVKILALLDHPNIVRYYQAWLEKVEEGTLTSMGLLSSANGGSDAMGSSTAPPRNYSMSNLLAPVSEMDFSNQQKSMPSFYSNGSFGDNDGGFDWDRGSADGEADAGAWREEDLAYGRSSSTKSQQHQIIEPNVLPAKAAGGGRLKDDGEDSSCYSTDRCDHWLYIQMQYCAGRNLGDYLAIPTRSMELPKLFKIFTQIASAISHVHSCGLIHRDLKPANIFVADTEGDSIKLGDFGLSRYAANVNLTSSTTTTTTTTSTSTTTIEEHSTALFINGGPSGHIAGGSSYMAPSPYSVSKWSISQSNMSESQEITAGVGTYLYASPEQVAGKKYNAKTDMYSLGMILFELCHERFTTTMERYVTLRNARERKYPPKFEWKQKSPEIMEMLDRLLHQDPMARPDAAEVVQWSQELYELSLAQHHMATSSSSTKAHLRSPIHHARSFNAGTLPSLLSLEHGFSAFSLQVEARMTASVGGDDAAGGSGGNGERRLPNHNLLKEICDVIAQVSGGRMEIKKCGLHLQDGGVQVLDFVLDPHVRQQESGKKEEGGEEQEHGEVEDDAAVVSGQKKDLIEVIQALPGVHTVRLDM